MQFKIINQITGQVYNNDKKIQELLKDFEDRNKIFRLVNLFNDSFSDLKLIPKSITKEEFFVALHNVQINLQNHIVSLWKEGKWKNF